MSGPSGQLAQSGNGSIDDDIPLSSKSPEKKYGTEKRKKTFVSSSKRSKTDLQERAAMNKLHDGFFSDTEQISVALQQRKEDNKYGTLSKNRLKFDKDSPVVKGGSMTDLILWLIDFSSDRELILSFLISYPVWWTAEQLFRLVTQKFASCKQDNTPQGNRDLFATLDFVNIWIETYFMRDFTRHPLPSLLRQFLHDIRESGFADYSNRLKLLVLKRSGQRYMTPTFQIWASKTLTAAQGKPKKKEKEKPSSNQKPVYKCSELHAEDLAEQLTLVEWELFSEIEESEFLSRIWMKAQARNSSGSGSSPSTSPNFSPRTLALQSGSLKMMIDQFQKVSLWVASEVVAVADAKERAAVMKKFISAAEKCLELNNFNGAMEIISGLNMSAVLRLAKTWMLVPGPFRASFERMSQLLQTTQNFQNYRSAIGSCRLPAVPYIGIYLRDFTFIDEGNPDKLEDGSINFDKIHLNGKVILDAKKFQKEPYTNLKSRPTIQEYLRNIANPSEEETFHQSLKLEPDEALEQALASPKMDK